MLTSADADRLRVGLFDVLRGTIAALAIGSPWANCDALLRRLRAAWSSDAERLGFNEARVLTTVEPDGTVPHGLDAGQQLADHGTGHRAVTWSHRSVR